MNIDHYRTLLLDRERELMARMERALANARERSDDPAGDAGDESLDDERRAEQIDEASADSTELNQVREALRRIDNGTFGLCVVDNEPIEPKRLEAIPWTPYCARHAALLDTPGRTTL